MKKISPIKEKTMIIKIKECSYVFFILQDFVSLDSFCEPVWENLVSSRDIFSQRTESAGCINHSSFPPFILAESSVMFEVPSCIEFIHMKRDRTYETFLRFRNIE